jgi:hypothetical protein
MIAAARERIKTFIDAWQSRRGLDPRVIHGLDSDKELLTADIRALLDATALQTRERIPNDVLDKLWMAAHLHADDSGLWKLRDYGEKVQDEYAARNPVPAWQTGEPPVPKGKEREFIVAVRRKSNGKVYVFAATFANQYANDMSDRDGGEFIADGWYNKGLDMSHEFDSVYEPMLEAGDAVEGWQELPKWTE